MRIVSFILVCALLLCLAPMPYGYYELVRFCAMAAFAFFAYKMWDREEQGLTAVFIALALLFQPFIKIALGRTLWNVTDVAVAALLIVLVARKKL